MCESVRAQCPDIWQSTDVLCSHLVLIINMDNQARRVLQLSVTSAEDADPGRGLDVTQTLGCTLSWSKSLPISGQQSRQRCIAGQNAEKRPYVDGEVPLGDGEVPLGGIRSQGAIGSWQLLKKRDSLFCEAVAADRSPVRP